MRLLFLSCVFFTAIGGCPAFAQEASEQPVRIELNQDSKSFVFIIDDEPVAMLDKSGMHVVGEINYGSYSTDTGSAWIKDKIDTARQEETDD